jgi:hypothetical protein
MSSSFILLVGGGGGWGIGAGAGADAIGADAGGAGFGIGAAGGAVTVLTFLAISEPPGDIGGAAMAFCILLTAPGAIGDPEAIGGGVAMAACILFAEPLGKAVQYLFMNDIQSSIFPFSRKLAACT